LASVRPIVGGKSKNTSVHGLKKIEKTSDFDIQISDPQTVGEGMKAYTVYRITSKYTGPDSGMGGYVSGRECVVHRRFREFIWIYTRLTQSNPGKPYRLIRFYYFNT
jgi:hypothetical protein